jgi:hypothetical protein
MVNRTQALVLGFTLLAWITVIVVLVTTPEVFDPALPAAGHRRAAEVVFLIVLSAFLGLLPTGVLRRWRWTFWLILAAFLLGLARVPVAVLQLTGRLAVDGPTWYAVLQEASA